MPKLTEITDLQCILLLVARSLQLGDSPGPSGFLVSEAIVLEVRRELKRQGIQWDAPIEDFREALERTNCWHNIARQKATDLASRQSSGYVGVMDYRDGSRSFDWSVPDSAKYQAVVDARNAINPVAQAFLVPAVYEQRHQINWSTISVCDLDRAGCGTTILYPRNPAPEGR
jgi:hypothetical protein